AHLEDTALLGELSLEGRLRHTDGVLPMVGLARDRGLHAVAVPEANASEASLVSGLDVFGAATLAQLVEHLRGGDPITPWTEPPASLLRGTEGHSADLVDIRGQEHAKRALEVAAAGGHNMLMVGPPGSGKTLLARALPSIMPPLSPEEALETTKVYSVAGMLPSDTPLVASRPFRAPHHTVSPVGMRGTLQDHKWQPGECSLAHGGVLVLDDVPEFRRRVLEIVRVIVDEGVAILVSGANRLEVPARFTLIATAMCCPCGFFGGPRAGECTCSQAAVDRYTARIPAWLTERCRVLEPDEYGLSAEQKRLLG
ncbi:MAG: ATP-binding protein, partial [Planctomycetes bacterium]|nr:ATP-binding protein [Planctomycetota bacterium]